MGYPDQLMGERVAAFVVADGPFDLGRPPAWFAERGLARFKTPERVVRLVGCRCSARARRTGPPCVAGRPWRPRAGRTGGP